MNLGLGIDTGGTYTDAAVMDLSTGEILDSNKALTTYSDLIIGIKNVISGLNPEYLKEVHLVSVSTTLATNSTLEGKGYPAGLILVGYSIPRQLSTRHMVSVNGGHDTSGNEIDDLDTETVRNFVIQTQSRVAAFAVSSYFGVRNPEHELKVKEIIQNLTDLPVVCGHELSQGLGAYERAVTALLNAQLIPINESFIKSVKAVMQEKNIDARLMMMKCDGSLVRIEDALERPVESIFSGPAASLVGAAHITRLRTCATVDVGGTSTDIALISEGIPEISDSGAVVGDWKTMVKAIRMKTSAMGGDSHVWVQRKAFIGPQRVIPLCLTASHYPALLEKLDRVETFQPRIMTEVIQPTNFFVRHRGPAGLKAADFSPAEEELLKIIGEEPASIFEISEKIGSHPIIFSDSLKALLQRRAISQIGFTPTDALHVLGEYTAWDREAALKGAGILARYLKLDREAFASRVKQQVAKNIALNLVSFFVEGLKKTDLEKVMDQPEYIRFRINVPVVLIGAPVKAYVSELKQIIDAEIRVPEHHEVGNAIGALVGNVIKRVEILIRQLEAGSREYAVFSEKERMVFGDYKEALEYGLGLTRSLVEEHMAAYRLGPDRVHFDLKKDNIGPTLGQPVETRLSAIGIGTLLRLE
ncbi:hydantoinase [Methanosarcina sp. 1.H.T.1A.1]|uniref:hydantoinase/oxoprolinase family protein n=1 Tax=Methanosarcina sp. 1.H.T.1A.1 TaxID=1483602 RepID=UPI0006220321|nr:hydantoinase/oxoprolinase family protein [Methanosarcina sp. 1.H.T.1A.1]KKH91862.1 hydantoinase [Methanosarcina sp. 1.H.T.1A.1]